MYKYCYLNKGSIYAKGLLSRHLLAQRMVSRATNHTFSGEKIEMIVKGSFTKTRTQ